MAAASAAEVEVAAAAAVVAAADTAVAMTTEKVEQWRVTPVVSVDDIPHCKVAATGKSVNRR